MNKDFFIGWQPKENLKINGLVKLFVLSLFAFIVLMSFAITKSERGFADSYFEFGTETEFEGIYFDDPYPVLVYSDKGKVRSAILVDFGKLGAEPLISAYETKNKIALNGRLVKIKGTKIYRGSSVAIEMTDGEEAIVMHHETGPIQISQKSALTSGPFTGEIIDLKCYLGVMKPAEAKPHRSCAVRCISGGIPPMLRVKDGDKEEYYLLTSGNNESVSVHILDYVADQVRLCGEVSVQNGWKTLTLDLDFPIQRLWPHWADNDMVLCKP